VEQSGIGVVARAWGRGGGALGGALHIFLLLHITYADDYKHRQP
jgi:hypothetical protein